MCCSVRRLFLPAGNGYGGNILRETCRLRAPRRRHISPPAKSDLLGQRDRRGQALVEFAIVALVVYLLLGGILTFGQLFYEGQTVQQAADVAAREISRTPLSATANLMDVLYSNNPSDY